MWKRNLYRCHLREFMLTYGWSILAVLATVGTLAYFGAFEAPVNPYISLEQSVNATCEQWARSLHLRNESFSPVYDFELHNDLATCFVQGSRIFTFHSGLKFRKDLGLACNSGIEEACAQLGGGNGGE